MSVVCCLQTVFFLFITVSFWKPDYYTFSCFMIDRRPLPSLLKSRQKQSSMPSHLSKFAPIDHFPPSISHLPSPTLPIPHLPNLITTLPLALSLLLTLTLLSLLLVTLTLTKLLLNNLSNNHASSVIIEISL